MKFNCKTILISGQIPQANIDFIAFRELEMFEAMWGGQSLWLVCERRSTTYPHVKVQKDYYQAKTSLDRFITVRSSILP